MDKLKNKSILLIMPKYFGYENIIKNYLCNEGAIVEVVYENLNYYSFFYNLVLKVFKKYNSKIYFNYYKKRITKSSFDYVIVIRGETLYKDSLEYIKRMNPNAKYCLYQWDSVENNANAIRIAKYFNRVSTFDMIDAKKYNWVYRPLFCSKFTKNRDHRTIDYCYISSLHSNRYIIAKKLKENYKCKGFIFLYANIFFYFKQKYLNKNESFKEVEFNEVKFKSLSLEEVFDILSKSNIVIDYTHPKQNGFTMRTIEALGNKCKIVTNNKNVLQSDFYNSDNVYVYDDKSFEIPEHFFGANYKEIGEDVYYNYSLESWIEGILGI